MDTVERDLPKWVRFFLESDGDRSHFTVSSDAAANSPGTLFAQVRECVLRHGLALELIVPFVTANTARVLKLKAKGRLLEGNDADVLVLHKEDLEIRDVIARGRRVVKDGKLNLAESFLKSCNRSVTLNGDKS